MRKLKVGFDRWLRRRVAFDTAGIWPTAAALAWFGYFAGALWTACALTLLAVYLRFCLSKESQR